MPIPPDLIARLRRRQDWYEASDADGGFDPAFDLDAFDLDAFAAEGRAIARAVKAALPHWAVVYFDEAGMHRALKAEHDPARSYRGLPRSTCEYGIALPPSAPDP